METTKKIIIFNLLLIFCLTAFLKVKAESAQTQLSLAITGGSLSIAAPQNANFAEKSFSFTNQTSANNGIGNVQITDARGTKAGWDINISASDWADSADNSKVMKYNGNGTNEGQLSLGIPNLDQIATVAGDGTSQLSMGVNDNFDSSVSSIKLVSAPYGAGSGEYSIAGLNASQLIPGNQPTGSYKTDLTITIQ